MNRYILVRGASYDELMNWPGAEPGESNRATFRLLAVTKSDITELVFFFLVGYFIVIFHFNFSHFVWRRLVDAFTRDEKPKLKKPWDIKCHKVNFESRGKALVAKRVIRVH